MLSGYDVDAFDLSVTLDSPLPHTGLVPSRIQRPQKCRILRSQTMQLRPIYAYLTLGPPAGACHPPPHPGGYPFALPPPCRPTPPLIQGCGGGAPAQPPWCMAGMTGCCRLGLLGWRQRRTMQPRMLRRRRPPMPQAIPITRLRLSLIQELISLAVEEPLHWPCSKERMD